MLIPKIAGMSTADRNDFKVWCYECCGIKAGHICLMTPDEQDRLYESYQDSMQYSIDSSG